MTNIFDIDKIQKKQKIGRISMREKNKNKGITLIALVITIIVLLILAAVSIATLTGENGILMKSQIAKTRTEYTSAKEIIRLKLIEIRADCITKEKDFNLNEIKEGMSQADNIEIEGYFYSGENSIKQEEQERIRIKWNCSISR